MIIMITIKNNQNLKNKNKKKKKKQSQKQNKTKQETNQNKTKQKWLKWYQTHDSFCNTQKYFKENVPDFIILKQWRINRKSHKFLSTNL